MYKDRDINEDKYIAKDSDIQKEKIRTKYKGVNPDELDIIPAIPQVNFYEDKNEKRVAVYARVSTDDIRQTSSYELQKNHYMDVIGRHEGWKLVEIYADEGISGTSLKRRDAFVKMINDCKAGKIDLIVTKSVSRFARNVVDCIGYVRELKQLQPAVGIFFETENIHTLDSSSEMILILMATLAQEESHTKSEVMNSSIEMHAVVDCTPCAVSPPCILKSFRPSIDAKNQGQEPIAAVSAKIALLCITNFYILRRKTRPHKKPIVPTGKYPRS